MNFPDTKISQPKEVKIPVKDIIKIIRESDLRWWAGYGGINIEGLDELIAALQDLKTGETV